MADVLEELRDAFQYDRNRWQDIRDEAKIDMRFVSGDPWDKDDRKARENRPTVAPEEMGQYFNQVINALRANPRGAKFSPVGNGANDKTAELYQRKWREVEYRSHAQIAYITAAENAIQRSYGFARVRVDYASPRSANQDIWIDAMPNPDMVMPDSDALRPDSADMKRCFVYRWMSQADFTRQFGEKAKKVNFSDFQGSHPDWIKGNQVLLAEYWRIVTRKRELVLVQPGPQMNAQGAPVLPPPQQVFRDELKPGMQVVQTLRDVDYPEVKMVLTNGIEILHEQGWLGKFIPIVSCYGKVIYVDGTAGMERKILSMTRFGRDPWKSYCYACSQELEVLGMVPKAPFQVWAGQLRGYEKDWQESPHTPKAYLQKHHLDENGQPYPALDGRVDYLAGQHLQAIELVKEGYRRAIQAAMGSNFMPTTAQRRNEKSGIALEKIEQAATQGTYHFVNSFEDLIRRCAEIGEDLMDKIHDYRGEIDVIDADGTAARVPINDPQNPEAISTRGDHVVTISTAPNSDSERESVESFTDTLVGNLQIIAGVSGPKAAAAVLARSVRMRNLGPLGDQLADLIEPEEYKAKNGQQQAPSPELLSLKAENDQLKGVLQQAASEKQAKVVETQGKFAIATMQEAHEDQRAAADRETKITVAELGAKVDKLALFLEERERLGVQMQATLDRVHAALESAKDRIHDHALANVQHRQALEQGQQGVAGQLAVQAAAPQPDAGAGA